MADEEQAHNEEVPVWRFDADIQVALNRLHPDARIRFCRAAWLQERPKRRVEAARIYRELIDSYPRCYPAYVSLAALVGLGAWDASNDWNAETERRIAESEALLRKAIEVEPEYPNAHYFLALTLRDQGYARQAADEFRAALRCGLRRHFWLWLYARKWLLHLALGLRYEGQKEF